MGFVEVSGYSQADLDAARQEGYDAGYQAGYQAPRTVSVWIDMDNEGSSGHWKDMNFSLSIPGLGQKGFSQGVFPPDSLGRSIQFP